jgi:hypothetical protein
MLEPGGYATTSKLATSTAGRWAEVDQIPRTSSTKFPAPLPRSNAVEFDSSASVRELAAERSTAGIRCNDPAMAL